MKGKKALAAVALAFVLLIGGAVFLYGRLADRFDPSLMTEVEQGEMQSTTAEENGGGSADSEAQKIIAPDFTVYDTDGNAVKLSDFYGKPMIINFWASWCGPCQMEMPEFQKAYDEYGDEINFVVVNMTDGQRETVESAVSFMEQSGYTFPVYYDTDMDAAATYGVYALPTTYFADSDGYLVAHAKSMLTADMMAQGIGMIYTE